MRNRYGDSYEFVKVGENTYVVEGDLRYWRFGGMSGNGIDMSNLAFADPSGGPFIAVGSYKIEGKTVTRINAEGYESNRIFFEVSE